MEASLLHSIYGQHPARRISYNALRANLEARMKPEDGNPLIMRVEEDGLEIYHYTRECVYEQKWDYFTLLARGLVLSRTEKKVAASPLIKFFNYGEITHWIPDEHFSVQEKIDGSLGILFNHEDKWRVITKFSFKSDQAQWAQSFLDSKVDTDGLIPGWTYLVEIVYQENRIVVTYDFEGLILLTCYDADGFEQVTTSHCVFPVAPYHKFSNIDEIIKHCETLSYEQEGFVIRFESGYRVKIKGADYLARHREAFLFGPLRVWEVMRGCGDLDEMKKVLPEEFWVDFDSYVAYFNTELENVISHVVGCVERVKHLSDRELGINLDSLIISRVGRQFVFKARKSGFRELVSTPGFMRNRMFELFKPKNNILAGINMCE